VHGFTLLSIEERRGSACTQARLSGDLAKKPQRHEKQERLMGESVTAGVAGPSYIM